VVRVLPLATLNVKDFTDFAEHKNLPGGSTPSLANTS
jgi:hypothetical protein